MSSLKNTSTNTKEVLQGFRDSFQPANRAEDALVVRLAHAHWRTLRSRRVETEILYTTAKYKRHQARKLVKNCPEHLDLHGAIAVGFMTLPAERWQMYLRYDAAISREFFRTLDALTKMQRVRELAVRQQQVTDTQAQPARPKVLTAGRTPELSESGIRSVSNSPGVKPQSGETKPPQPAPLPCPKIEPASQPSDVAPPVTSYSEIFDADRQELRTATL